MTGNDKKPAQKPSRKKPPKPGAADDLYDDGDIATPKRDFNEDEIKDEEDKRM